MSDSIRILSIDGGGIRGIIPAMVIQALLGKLKAQDVFHIIAGTSTGGIIACGLAKPNPISLQDIINLYVEHGSEIFKKGLIDWSHYLGGPRYNPTALEKYLASQLGNTYLSDFQKKSRPETHVRLCSSVAGRQGVCCFPKALTAMTMTSSSSLLLAPLRRHQHTSHLQRSPIRPSNHSA